ncbi:MAG: hypothetical protein ACOX05_02925 [Bacillota bacterium]|jgi:hypothetical protein
MKKPSILSKILLLCLSCFLSWGLLAGCSNNPPKTSINSAKKDAWYTKYNLETNKVSVWDVNEGKIIFEMTDAQEVKSFIEALDLDVWRAATTEEELTGMPAYFFDLNNGTAFCIYEDVAYGKIFNRVESQPTGSISGVGGEAHWFFIPDKLFKTAKGLIIKYTP